MSTEQREVIADWLIVFGALGLLVSLFLPWSHQLPGGLLAVSGASEALRGVPRDPTAWQVYSTADALLALLAAALFAIALIGSRRARIVVSIIAALALAFVIHAADAPPTNGVATILPALQIPAGLRPVPSPATGLTVAITALAVSLVGLGISFTAD